MSRRMSELWTMNGRFESIDSAFLSAPPVPRIGSSGKKTMRGHQGEAAAQARSRSAFQCRLSPILPSHTGASLPRIRSMIGVPRIGRGGLGRWLRARGGPSPNRAAGRKTSSGYEDIFTSLSPGGARSTMKPDAPRGGAARDGSTRRRLPLPRALGTLLDVLAEESEGALPGVGRGRRVV